MFAVQLQTKRIEKTPRIAKNAESSRTLDPSYTTTIRRSTRCDRSDLCFQSRPAVVWKFGRLLIVVGSRRIFICWNGLVVFFLRVAMPSIFCNATWSHINRFGACSYTKLFPGRIRRILTRERQAHGNVLEAALKDSWAPCLRSAKSAHMSPNMTCYTAGSYHFATVPSAS
jgi:hypothetical protein